MKVSEQEILYLARLARLQISDRESEEVSQKLSDILTYISKLREVENLQEITPDSSNQNENIFREDISSTRVDTEDALRRSPDPDKEFFRVPKVIN